MSPKARSRAIESVGPERLLGALEMLTGTASRAGDEAALAEAVCEWGNEAAPGAAWSVRRLGPTSANLVTTFPFDGDPTRCKVMMYTHLDTSLSGEPSLDYPLTGTAAGAPRLEVDGRGAIRGFGLAVSKAPAACALTAYVALADACKERGAGCAPFGVLLTAGGTHRAPSGGFPTRYPSGLDVGLGCGVDAALRAGVRPQAVINVKGGASGVLREEPGCMLLRLEMRDRMEAVPARGAGAGAVVRAARVAELVEDWRDGYVTPRRGQGREIAADAGVGAIEGGLPYKPDILPAVANVYAYIVTLPEEDLESVVTGLETHIHRSMSSRDPGWSRSSMRTEIYGMQPGASTDGQSEVVLAARGAWEDAFGPGSADVCDYTGSTDGVIFRRNGIDTARFGVTARASHDNPATDCVSLDEMLAVTSVYVDTLERLI